MPVSQVSHCSDQKGHVGPLANSVGETFIHGSVGSVLGAFAVSLLGSVYTRLWHGYAFPAMVPGVLLLVPKTERSTTRRGLFSLSERTSIYSRIILHSYSMTTSTRKAAALATVSYALQMDQGGREARFCILTTSFSFTMSIRHGMNDGCMGKGGQRVLPTWMEVLVSSVYFQLGWRS